jgi:DNA-binding IclR family transcriptional regulator
MKQAPRPLGNARRLLDVLAEEGSLTVARLAEALDAPRSSVSRLVDGLAAVNLVTIRPNGSVMLASRWLHLADVAREVRVEWEPARRALRRLAAETECTSVLCIYHDGAPLCLDWVPGKATEILLAKPGRQLPLHAGAEGRAILAGLTEAELDAVVARAPFEAFTEATMLSADELRGDVARTRRQGYVLALDDALLGLGSIAVPIHDPVGGQPGSIAVASLSEEILRRSGELSRRLMEAARSRPAA